MESEPFGISPSFGISSRSSTQTSHGSVRVKLSVYLGYIDYGVWERVRGKVKSRVTGTSASNVNFLEAGGALLRGGYTGPNVEYVDTGDVPNVLSVNTGWTSYYTGFNDHWVMTGHSYFSIEVGSNTWEKSIWKDASKTF